MIEIKDDPEPPRVIDFVVLLGNPDWFARVRLPGPFALGMADKLASEVLLRHSGDHKRWEVGEMYLTDS